MDNLKGHTAAFANFSYFKSFWSRTLERVVLMGAGRHTATVREMAFLHTAHFCRILPKHLRRAGLRPDGDLEHGALLFLSTYNGDGDEYFRAFSRDVPDAMHDVWNRCLGWQQATPYPLLRAFIRTHRRDTQMFHNAYPDTVKRIRSSLRLRRALDDLCAKAVATDVSDETFQDAFRRVALSHWGNGSSTEANDVR